MAKTKELINGKVGNMIFYRVNGETRVRSVPTEYHDANTPEQQQVRLRLVAVVRFYQNLKDTWLREVWRVAAKGQAASGYTLFLKRNISVFNAETIADPLRLRLAEGCLPGMNDLREKERDGSRIVLAWQNSLDFASEDSADRLRVVALFEGRLFSPVWLSGVDARRRDREASVDLGDFGKGGAHLYCFFESPDGGSFSPSVCLYVEGRA